MKAEITKEHAWLAQLVGEWTAELPSPEGDGTVPATESIRLMGEAWLLREGRFQMSDGTPMHTLMTLGFDPVQRAFVGSWIGSMMNHLWVYRGGSLDSGGMLLKLPSEGPKFDGSAGTAQYRDEIEIVSADEHLLHGNLLGDDGQWTRFMTARYRRVR